MSTVKIHDWSETDRYWLSRSGPSSAHYRIRSEIVSGDVCGRFPEGGVSLQFASQLDLGLLFSHRDKLHCLLCLSTGLPTFSPTDVHECFQPVSFVVLDV